MLVYKGIALTIQCCMKSIICTNMQVCCNPLQVPVNGAYRVIQGKYAHNTSSISPFRFNWNITTTSQLCNFYMCFTSIIAFVLGDKYRPYSSLFMVLKCLSAPFSVYHVCVCILPNESHQASLQCCLYMVIQWSSHNHCRKVFIIVLP